MKNIFICLLSVGLLFTPSVVRADSLCASAWNCYEKGVLYKERGEYSKAIEALKRAIATYPTQAPFYGHLGDSYQMNGEYQKAYEAYYKKAQLLKGKGLMEEYFYVLKKANALFSDVEWYTENSSAPAINLAKYEPTSGVYIGAFIGSESKYKTSAFSWNNGNEFDDFNAVTEKKHAMYLDYGSYGNDLTESFQTKVSEIKATGGAMQIAYEPGELKSVTREGIVLYAKELADTKIPIFLRYASEMNGDWVPWGGNPKEYIQNWRMVHDVMEEYADNVVMVWSPSEMPKNGMFDYYPGDEYVDWVGLSVYNAQFANGDTSQPTDEINPLDALDYIYEEYADRKPIMVSEYAASHEAGRYEERQDTSSFAKTKMTQLYEGIKLKYPRVKAINWFSQNSYRQSVSARTNYSLLEGEMNGTLAHYKNQIKDNYYLSDVVNGPYAKVGISSTKSYKEIDKKPLSADRKISLHAKTYDPYISKALLKVNGVFQEIDFSMPFEFSIHASLVKPGLNEVEVVLYDSKEKEAYREKQVIYEPYLSKEHVRIKLGENLAFSRVTYQTIETAPYIKSNRTMVPLRFISEQLGYAVHYDSATQNIEIVGNKSIQLTPGNKKMMVNGVKNSTDVAPEIKNSRTFVPIRVIAEALSRSVFWEGDERVIIIQ